MQIEVRVLQSDEAAILQNVAEDVFDNPINQKSCRKFFEDPNHYLVVALDGDLVVGMTSVVKYFHPDKPVEIWINEVGVAPGYQRHGLGTRLLEEVKELGRKLGCAEAWVLTELDNDGGNGLYSRVGSKHENVVYHTFSLKE